MSTKLAPALGEVWANGRGNRANLSFHELSVQGGGDRFLAMRTRAFGEFVFPGSAPMAFAQAAESAQADPEREHPEAWLIEDRRIELDFEGSLSRSQLGSFRRVVEALARQAVSGEMVIESDTGGRWQFGPPSMATPTGSGLRQRSLRSRPRARGAG